MVSEAGFRYVYKCTQLDAEAMPTRILKHTSGLSDSPLMLVYMYQ